MVTGEFQNNVNDELARIRSRCLEINETIRALEEERDLMKDCEELLATLQDRYGSVRQSIEDARKLQVRLSPSIEAPEPRIRQLRVAEQFDRPNLAAG